MKKFVILITVLAMLLGTFIPVSALPEAAPAAGASGVKVAAALPAYKDETNSYAERALDMVARMTLPEKASQTAGYNAAAIPRLGISGYMWWNEALHGYSQEGWFGIQTDGASYPSSYSMGASWDPDLYYQEAVEIGSEIRERVKDNKYNLSFFSPTVNLARDPRWGRNDESYGEDPYLVGLMGAAYVKGVEGKDENGELIYKNANGEGIKQALTTIKHYAANNSEKNRYTSGADNTTVREMREYYTRPARIVVDQADVSGVMMAYSSVAGIPISYSSYYMDTVLRQTYGFSGHIVSDCDSIATSYNRNIHRTNPLTGEEYNQGEAFAAAMAHGLDLQCNAGETDGLGSYASNYKKMLQNPDGSPVLTDKGYFTEQQLEVSVARLMTHRMELGEFDAVNDYVTDGAERLAAGQAGGYINGAAGQTQTRIDLADDLSRATIVLLKNEDQALPITEEEISAGETYNAAIIGPVGQSNFRGGYSSRSSNEANLVTIEQAIKTAFADTDTYSQGAIDKVNLAYHYGFSSAVSRSSFTRLKSEDIALDEVAENLDLAIVVVGQGSGDSREDGDRTDLHLAQAQIDLIKQVKAKNPKKLILVMETYGPVLMSGDIVDNADAILWSSFNGFRKGTGFGEAITGKNNPSGRTNATWLKDCIGDIPGFFDYNLFPVDGEGGRTYMYNVEETIYPFGYGLSYADVDYAIKGASMLGASAKGGLVLGTDAAPITKDSSIDVSFTITNTNGIEGKQVAEVYVVSPDAGKGDIPQKRLVGFDKVNVPADGTVDVTIPVQVTDFGFFDEEKDCYELPSGEWQIWVAKSSDLNEETDLCESFTVENGAIREDPTIITVKPTQVGDGEENGVYERVIFNLSADKAKNIINPNVAVTMANEKLYGTRVINNVPGEDIGVDPQAVNEATNATEDKFNVPDTAKLVERLDAGKSKEDLPQVGTKFVLPDTYKVEYASNHEDVIAVENGQLVMKAAGVATITVTVTAPSGEKASTDFAVAVKAAPAITSLSVGGEAIEDFDTAINAYNCVIPEGVAASDKALALTAEAIEGAEIEAAIGDGEFVKLTEKGINPGELPCTITLKVSGKDIPEQYYFVKYERQFSGTSFLNGEIDDVWTIINEDKEAYEAVPGLGLRLPMQAAGISAANDNWKNLFTRPIGGDWTMITKLAIPQGISATGQQVQFLAFQDPNNKIQASFGAGGGGWFWGGGGAPTTLSFSIAPTVDGATNGSTSHTISKDILVPTTEPMTVYVKVQHTDMRLDFWYSIDGINYTKVQSADGRRTGESSYLPDAVFGLYVTGGTSNTSDQGVYCEYMDVISMDGKDIKTEQGVLNDAFKAVAEYAKTIIPKTVSEDIALTIPQDYTVIFEADDCINRDGTINAPEKDQEVNVKIKLSHPTAKIGGSTMVTIYDGPITVKGSGEAGEGYGLNRSVMNVMVGAEDTVNVNFGEGVMSASISVKDPAIASVSAKNVTAAAPITVKGLAKGETTVDVTFYGMPNNVELGTVSMNLYVGGAEMFDDVLVGDWSFEGIDFALANGLMNGMGKNLFKPGNNLTRAQLVTILYRLEGSPAVEFKGIFEDVADGLWYSDAIEWAYAEGIVNGKTAAKFAPNDFITREQIAAILYRYEGEPEVAGELDFPDAATVSGYAKDAMIWASSEGLINGIASQGVTNLAPQKNATRAQIASIMMRYLAEDEEVEEPA